MSLRGDYDVLWDGSHSGRDEDLLCVHPPSVPQSERPTPAWWQAEERHRHTTEVEADRQLLLELLGTQPQARGTLRLRAQLTHNRFQVAFDGLVRTKRIERSDRWGWWRRA